MKPNNLEKAITKGVRRALKYYTSFSDRWLFHAPESFLQHEIARSIVKFSDHPALAELSPKRMAEAVGKKSTSKSKKRFDIVVMCKSRHSLWAVMEVNRANGKKLPKKVRRDADKLKEFWKANKHVACYLLVYSEVNSAAGRDTGTKRHTGTKRRDKLFCRFGSWAKDLKGWRMVDRCVVSPKDCKHDSKEWSWGFVQFRLGGG